VLSYSNLGIGGRLPITEAGGRSCEVALRPVRFGAERSAAALRAGRRCAMAWAAYCAATSIAAAPLEKGPGAFSGAMSTSCWAVRVPDDAVRDAGQSPRSRTPAGFCPGAVMPEVANASMTTASLCAR